MERTLPIWIDAWEMECCIPDIVIGQHWEAPIALEDTRLNPVGLASPGWQVSSPSELVAFKGRSTRGGPADGRPVLIDLGTIQVGSREDFRQKEVEGQARFWARWHGYFDSPEGDGGVEAASQVEGTVVRIFSVPGIYEESEPGTFLLKGFGEPSLVERTTGVTGESFFLVELAVDT